jgi:hypothetical protein
MRIILASCIASLLTSCAANGVRYSDDPQGMSPVADQMARITIYRTNQKVQYFARSTTVKLNGESLGGISSGGFRIVDVEPGSHTLEADMWDAPGRCTLTLKVTQGETAYFEISPRSANLAAGTPGAVVPNSTAGGLLVGGVLMLAGMAAESAGKQCGGAFAVTQVKPEDAVPKLVNLLASK